MAQERLQRNAQDSKRATQGESKRQGNEAAAKASEDSRRNARGQEKKAQQQSEQRAKDATVKAQGKPQRNTSEREQKPPRVSEQPANQGPDPIEKGSARLLKKDSRKKNKAPESSPEKPAPAE